MLHKNFKSANTYIFALIFSVALFLGANVTGCGTSGKAGPFVIPTVEPTQEPTVEPTDEPTVEPTEEPTVEPTDEPTGEPTDEPTGEPTVEPTDEPTVEPTDEPSVEPTDDPSVEPTDDPSVVPDYEEVELTGFTYDPDSDDVVFDKNSVLAYLGYTGEYEETEKTFFGHLYKDGQEVTKLEIPETFEKEGKTYKITGIANYALYGCNLLVSVVIPDGVTSIGEGAFFLGESITSLTIPDSVASIGEGAFYGCASLTAVNLPPNLETIDDFAFYGCKSLTSVTIPDSVTHLGEEAFDVCDSLTSITWNGTKYTDPDAFNKDVKDAGIANMDVWVVE